MSSMSFAGDGLPQTARVVGFRASEGISVLYRFDVFLIVPDSDSSDLDFDALLGTRGALSVRASEHDPSGHDYHGVIDALELVHSHDGRSLLAVSLVPALHTLSLGHHGRMFTDMTIPDIVRKVIEDSGIDSTLDIRTDSDHPVEEHVCQYRESDFDFLARWMAREGMYFFFDHETGPEKLVITDQGTGHDPCLPGPVRYHPVAAADITAGEAMNQWRLRAQRLPARVALHDYDPLKPSLAVEGEAAVSGLGSAERRHHEARFFTSADGARLAGLRSEEHLAQESVFEGMGSLVGLRPGRIFRLEGHPDDALNQDYLVVAVEHEGAQMLGEGAFRDALAIRHADGYRVRLTAVPANVPYRAAAGSAWPRVDGYVLGVVDGEADGDYAQLDEHGRYQVRLFFDESDLADGKASTRVRMLQPHAGAPEGWHFPLRKGTEVVVEFHGGDPDRPVIAGAVPNAENPSPVTSANHTQNVLQTGGLTRIEIDDLDGKQYFYDFTPPEDSYLHLGHPFRPTHHVVLHTKGDNLFDIGTNQDITVGGVLDEQVKKAVKETYSAKQTSTIEGKKDTTVGGAVKETYLATQTTTVKGGLREEIDHNGQKTTVSGARSETYNNGQNTQVFGGTTEGWFGTFTRKVTGATYEDHNGTLSEFVDGAVTEIYPTSVAENYGATTATWESLTWMTGSIERHGPSFDVTTPSHSHFTPFGKEIGSVLFPHHATETLTVGLQLDRVGLLGGLFGAKVDLTGAIVCVCPNESEMGVVKLAPSGLLNKLAGFFKKS